jgi:hypothetical protein
MPENQTAPAQDQTSVIPPELLSVLSLAEANGGDALADAMKILERNDIKIVGADNKGIYDDRNTPGQQAPVQQNAPAPAQAPNPAPAPAKQNTDPNNILNDFIEPNAAPANSIVANSIEDITKILKDKYNIQDIPTFLESADKWRSKATQSEQEIQRLQNFKGAWDNLPPDLQDVMVAYYENRDYTEILNSPKFINLNKPFEQQDIAKVVRYLNPDINLSNKDADDYVDLGDIKDPSVKALINTAKTQYAREQASYKANLTSQKTAQQEDQRKFVSSVDASLQKLTTTLPTTAAERVKDVAGVLKSGDIEGSLFYQGDLLREDAAERAYYALHGKALIAAAKEKIAELNKTIETTVSGGSGDQPRQFKRGSNGQAPKPREVEHAEEFANAVSKRGSVYDPDPQKDENARKNARPAWVS